MVGAGPAEVLLQVFVVLAKCLGVLGGALLHQQLALVHHVVGVAEDPGELVKQLRLWGGGTGRGLGGPWHCSSTFPATVQALSDVRLIRL